MATTGTADNNQSVITRAGNPESSDVTNVAIGDNSMLANNGYTTNGAVTGTVTSVDDDVKPRDSDNQLGDQGLLHRTNSSQLTYTWAETVATSGYDVHGQIHPQYTQDQTSVTYDADEAANDSRSDGGEWFYNRSNTQTTNSYDAPTG